MRKATGVTATAFLLALITAAAAATEAGDAAEGTTVHRDLAYVTGGHPRQKLDLYIPEGDAPVPLVVYIHGGAFRAGDKGDQPPLDYFGPTDFLQMDAHRRANGMVHDPPHSPESQLVGGPIQENPHKVARANPITYVTAGAPPFLIVHGERDPLVPHHQSELLAEALRRAGVPVTFYTVQGGGHGGFDDPRVPELTKAFLREHLE